MTSVWYACRWWLSSRGSHYIWGGVLLLSEWLYSFNVFLSRNADFRAIFSVSGTFRPISPVSSFSFLILSSLCYLYSNNIPTTIHHFGTICDPQFLGVQTVNNWRISKILNVSRHYIGYVKRGCNLILRIWPYTPKLFSYF